MPDKPTAGSKPDEDPTPARIDSASSSQPRVTSADSGNGGNRDTSRRPRNTKANRSGSESDFCHRTDLRGRGDSSVHGARRVPRYMVALSELQKHCVYAAPYVAQHRHGDASCTASPS